MHLISPAFAQSLGGGTSLAGLAQFAPLVLIFGVFYFILIRPQQQKQKALKASLNAIKRGDRVLTAGGILAVVQKIKEGSDEVEVEIAPNVRVMVMRSTISAIIKPVAANDVKPAVTQAS
ncbi:preprotein translocase subunit YajC [Acidisoma silvae]|uniref:Sec translocon accessory complex subunit YajC n=1 Tax=Acidisoma silvae TaxID=2802396 RepID=A0A963YNS2_9PROT|nr:preprotein translocase subunit YajC [Acidisoma silvae]MCB8873951.1 preprotein translocase subunit YajC [Acidisoma silvae]